MLLRHLDTALPDFVKIFRFNFSIIFSPLWNDPYSYISPNCCFMPYLCYSCKSVSLSFCFIFAFIFSSIFLFHLHGSKLFLLLFKLKIWAHLNKRCPIITNIIFRNGYTTNIVIFWEFSYIISSINFSMIARSALAPVSFLMPFLQLQ